MGSNIEQLNSLNSYNSGPNGFGKINLISANSSTVNFNGKNHNTKLFVNNNLIIDTNYAYYQVLHIDYEIPSSTILSLQILNTKFLILVRVQIIKILHQSTYAILTILIFHPITNCILEFLQYSIKNNIYQFLTI